MVVYWDGKLLRDLTGNEYVDLLPIIVTGSGISQLLTVAKLSSGTGQAQATAVCESLKDSNIEQNVDGLSFDTTGSNTGLTSDAPVFVFNRP